MKMLMIVLSIVGACQVTFASTAPERIRLMSYNVENLFDTEHDEGKNDWEFLPKNFPGRSEACAKMSAPWMVDRCLENDWTKEKLETKLNQIKRVVDATGSQIPEIMAVMEIENEAVIRLLSRKLGYKDIVVTESRDARGIDTALLFNQKPEMKLLAVERIRVPVTAELKPTRDILKVTFKTNRQNLVVIVNHWPSQEASAKARTTVAELLMTTAAEEMKKGSAVVAMGDFNVIAADRPDPFYEVVSNLQRPFYLLDVHSTLQSSAKELNVDFSTYPAGTYFYANAFVWNMLDRIFVSPELLKGGPIQADLRSYRIFNAPFMTGATTIAKGPQSGSVITGTPLRYIHNTADPEKAGLSDHFPVLIDLTVH